VDHRARPTLALLVALALLCAGPVTAGGPSAARVYRIGVLETVGITSNATNFGAFRDGLRQLGYVEGENLVFEYRSTDGRAERFPDLAAELVKLEVDLIVTRGEPAALSAKHATRTIPIVMASSGDPTASGIVRNLSRPGGNVTGFHIMGSADLAGRRLRLLRELVPGLSRVGVLWHRGDIHAFQEMRENEAAARAMGIHVTSLEVMRPSELDGAFETALMAQIDALVTIADSMTVPQRARITQFAAMSRLPAIYGLREFVDAGGLVAYGTDRRDLFRRSAGYVDRILKGARPGDLPVEAPTKFELVINLRTARALGLTMPPSWTSRADDVVE
jgi:putative ABC transport system substrate-binding protein